MSRDRLQFGVHLPVGVSRACVSVCTSVSVLVSVCVYVSVFLPPFSLGLLIYSRLVNTEVPDPLVFCLVV